MTVYVAAAFVGYLLGSIPVALLVARRHGVNLYATADGNPGAWNALEQLGPRRALPAFLGDGLKGTLAGLTGLALASGGDQFAAAATGVAAAMLGHALPLFAGFRGGKSVMTFAGGMFVLAPLAATAALVLTAATTAVTRRFAYGARAGIFGVVPLQLATQPPERAIVTGALMTLIGVLFIARRSGRATSDPAAAPTR